MTGVFYPAGELRWLMPPDWGEVLLCLPNILIPLSWSELWKHHQLCPSIQLTLFYVGTYYQNSFKKSARTVCSVLVLTVGRQIRISMAWLAIHSRVAPARAGYFIHISSWVTEEQAGLVGYFQQRYCPGVSHPSLVTQPELSLGLPGTACWDKTPSSPPINIGI